MSAPACPVVILCGGKGTRLREETEYKPKPMVEVGGRAISRFGVLELDEDAVVSFREKPLLHDWISAGYFVFERSVLGELGSDDVMFEQAPMSALAVRGELRAYRHTGFWQPMDTYREY